MISGEQTYIQRHDQRQRALLFCQWPESDTAGAARFKVFRYVCLFSIGFIHIVLFLSQVCLAMSIIYEGILFCTTYSHIHSTPTLVHYFPVCFIRKKFTCAHIYWWLRRCHWFEGVIFFFMLSLLVFIAFPVLVTGRINLLLTVFIVRCWKWCCPKPYIHALFR